MIMASVRRRFFVARAPISLVPCVLGTLVLFVGASGAGADVISLRGGGQVTGKVLPDPDNKDKVQVWLLQGRKPLSFLKSQIVEITPKASALDTYFEKLKKVSATAQSHYDLGLWCEQNKLSDLAKLHYEAALISDKAFELAHRKLGHVFHDGYWLTRDDLNAVQGLVKYKGRWISTEERAKKQAEEELTANQNSWVRRIKILRQSIVNGPEDRRREAETQLMAIRDAEAVGPLLRVLGNDDPELRILLAHVLSKIPGKEATAGLVKQILAEPTDQVRPVIFDKLKSRDDPAVVTQLVRALGSSDVQVINRAAWTLGNLEAAEVVPRLIPALLSFEQRVVVPPVEGSTVLVSGMSGYVPLAPVAYSQNNVAFMTPPAVSAGAVAYGVTSAPLYGQSAVMGGPAGGLTIRPPEPRVVTYTYRNVEVLAALQKLTGRDFGYEIDDWKQWIAHDYNPAPKPARRVLEP
jgi:PBS lyase HEAT-like repeat